MSQHLREMWRGAIGRSRGIDYASAWGANQPEFWIVGNAPQMIGGDWDGYTMLVRASMSYTDALNPAAFIQSLANTARQRVHSGDHMGTRGGKEITTLYLIAEGRGKDGMNAGGARWVVGEAPVSGSQFQPTSVSIRGGYGKAATPSPRALNAAMYASGEDARKWIGENLAGVVTDESMFKDLAQTVVVYRGVSLPLGADPFTSVNDSGGVGHSWTVSQSTAKAIAERGRAGFSSGAQVMGDTYSVGIDPKYAKVPTVLRAKVTLMPPEQNGPAPYRPWTIDYVSEAEIDIPRGTEITLDGYVQAEKVDHGPDPSNPEYFHLVTWRWPSSWHGGNVKRTAVVR